jgi:hypothetical protein
MIARQKLARDWLKNGKGLAKEVAREKRSGERSTLRGAAASELMAWPKQENALSR